MRRQDQVQQSQPEVQAPVQQPPQVLSPNLPEVKGLYRDVTVYIRDNFFPHYNLYQKTTLQDKVSCYDKHRQDYEKYFQCIEDIEQTMKKNSATLQKKFGNAEEKDAKCQESCLKKSSNNKDQYVQCMSKCANNLKDDCVSVYNRFYDDTIGKNPEYKTLKQ